MVYAVERSGAMVAHARNEARRAEVSVHIIQADMEMFQLPVCSLAPRLLLSVAATTAMDVLGLAHRTLVPVVQDGVQVDVIAMLLGTISHLLTNEAAIRCFRAAAAAVKPGGLFVVELASPDDMFDGAFLLGDAWDATSADGQQLVVNYGKEGDEFGPISQACAAAPPCGCLEQGLQVLYGLDCGLLAQPSVVVILSWRGDALLHLQVVQRSVQIDEMGADQSVKSCLLEETVPQRLYTYQEVDLLGRMTGFEIVGTHGALDMTVGVDSEDSYALVVCFRKR